MRAAVSSRHQRALYVVDQHVSDGLAAEWAQWMQAAGMSRRTIEDRVQLLARLSRATGVEPNVTEWRELAAFLASAPSAGTRYTYFTHLRAWYRWLVLLDYRVDDPTMKLRAPRAPGSAAAVREARRRIGRSDVNRVLTASSRSPELPVATMVFAIIGLYAPAMTAPGWYSEPGNALVERYWDGAQWTQAIRNVAADRPRPAPGPAAAVTAEPVAESFGQKRPRRRWLVPVIAAAAVLIAAAVVLVIVKPWSDDGPSGPSAADKESAYLETAHGILPGESDRQLKAAATGICQEFKDGVTWTGIIEGFINGGLSGRQSGGIVAIAVITYCPEFKSDLPGVAGGH